MTIRNSKNKKGMILIVSFIVITTLIVISSAFLIIAVTAKALANKDYYTNQAFWLAEAGIERGRLEPDANWLSVTGSNPPQYYLPLYNDGAGIGQYEITKTQDAIDSKKFTYDSWGYIPSKTATNKKAEEGVRAVVKFNKYNIGEFAFSTQGSLDVKGSATIDGDVLSGGTISVGGSAEITGDALDNRAFVATFENVFGNTEAELLALPPDHIYTDPPNNQEGVDGLTWVNFSSGGTFKISSSGWTGSGILIVKGGDLEMTGGTFNGIIWVVGSLKISGNAAINGSIFVESGAEVETGITGSPVLTYDKTLVETALGEIDASFPTMEIDEGYKIISWEEL